jgi:transglutaminase-like putative cysteine protease
VTGRRRLGLVAAGATLLAAAPLSAIFETWSWLLHCMLMVGLIAGAAVLARTMRFPTWAQGLSMAGVLLIVLTWMFPSGEEFLALLPSPETFQHFGRLFTQAGEDTRSYGVPVPDREALLFVTVLGVGGCAVVVDLLTVVMRRPALAGLPMLAIYSVPVAVYIESVPVLPFIIGAIGFLWLLVADNVDRVRRFGRRFTGDGRDVDVWEPSPLAAAGRRLAAIGVAVAVLLPLAVPGVTTGLLSRLTQVGAGTGAAGFGGGGSGRVNLFASLSGSLNQGDTRDMIKVTTNEPDPYYLRLGVADEVTQQGFANRSPRGQSISRGLPDPRTDEATDRAGYKQYRAEVEILDLNMGLAPTYSSTIGAEDLGGAWSYDRDMQVLYSNRATTKDKTYTVDYVRGQFDPEDLKRARALDPSDPNQARYTSVPPDDYVDTLVADLVRGKRTPYDKVRAIYGYFAQKNGFSYSLTTAVGTTGSDIAAFLQNKVGYCQQYAAAMAWMVRAADIPARVAFGFTRGGDKRGNTYTLTNRNAHAWTEVYFQGFGWVPFDATPAAGVVGATRPAYAPDNDRPDPLPSSTAASAAPGADNSAGPGETDRPDRRFDDPNPAAPGAIGPTGGSTTALWVAGIAAALVALLLIPALGRVILRRRRHAATAVTPRTITSGAADGSGPPGTRDVTVTTESAHARRDAHAAWDELIDTMIDFRVPVDPTETPRVTAQRLIREAEFEPTPAEAATLLGSAEERARYARRPLQGGELPGALGKVRKGLARSATRRTRLVAVLMPPSVMLRWRLALADGSARWVTRFGRMRDVVARVSPRRLLTNRAAR